ncbi:MAG: hypothetical protein HOK65_03670 [Crocinitomicaceae bacterium]|nr:hypothetical protein [Crocinitomicaceae bacterium]
MSKSPTIVHKPDPFVQRANDQLELSFIRAITNKSTILLEDLLDKEGCYFGQSWSYDTTYFFFVEFRDWKENDGHIIFVDRYIALGEDLGKTALCFEQGRFPASLFPTFSLMNKPIALVLEMSNTHIVSIRACYDFLPEAEFFRRAQEN